MKIVPAILVSVALLSVVGWQRHTLVQLRTENAALASDASEARTLTAQVSTIAGQQTLADIANQLETLREETRHLPRLRNEVQQLREQKKELDRLRAENAGLKSAVSNVSKTRQVPIQPIRLTIRTLSNQGLSTPEAAVQTFFWACREGDADWLTHCIPLSPQLNSQQRAEACKDIGRQVMQRFQSPDCEIEIVARQDVNATSVQIGVIFHYSANWSEKGILTTRLNGQEWQVFYNR